MKKTILGTLLFSASLIIMSCGTTKEVQSVADSYSPEESTEIISHNTENSETTERPKETAIPKKKKKNALQEFFTFGNKDDYLKYDEINLFTKEITGLKEKTAQVVIRYDNQMAGFGSYNSAAYYFVQFDKYNRDVLAKAVDAYFSDFENKRLQRKGKKTDQAYGKIHYRLDWGTVSSSTPNNGSGDGYCGYEFVNNAPYFTIYNREFKNDYYERAGDATTRESPYVKFYFTKSQIKQLLSSISEENISKRIYDNDEGFITTSTEADEY